ncbi:MAG: ABC transporter permease [Alphaproteobacteria bacterium]|nr:ABC transporter permease [Alphaproteobacteria bacterium]
MGFLFAVIEKNLRRLLADRWSIAIWIGIPLVLGVMITAVTGGSGEALPKAQVIIADEDNSPASGALTDVLRSPGFSAAIEIEQMGRNEAMAELDAGRASAVLVIPAGFGEAFFNAKPTRLTLLENPVQLVGPEIAAFSVEALTDMVFYLQQGFANQLVVISGMEPESQRSALGGMFAVFGALTQAQPPVVEVKTGSSGGGGFGLALFPGLLMMTLIFAAQGVGDEIWIEREAGTLRRLSSTPGRGLAFLAGRAIAAAIIFVLVSLPLLTFGFFAFDFDPVLMPATLMWLALAGLVLTAIFTTVEMFSPNRRAGALFTIALMFPLLMAGGSFFPFEAMPEFMAALGRLTPNGMMGESLNAYLGGASAADAFGQALPISLAIGAFFTGVATVRFNTGFGAG